jgi:putative nucleotidyltransferase with HDIG domain
MQALDDYINQVTTLQPAPRVLAQLLVLLKKEDTDSAQVVELISFDPALTAKVLQRCNSVFWSAAHPVADMNEAVARVGFNEIYRLVALVVGEGVLRQPQAGYRLAGGELWQHSVTTALAARVIARRLGADENLVFTAGLLHDIGKLVLSSFLEDAYEPLLSRLEPSGLSFLEAEKSILGVEHAEVGGRLLTRWRFPASLINAVGWHHDPAKAKPHHQLAAYIYLGDIIAHCLGQAQGLQSFAVRGRPEALDILEITPREIENFLLDTEAELQQSSWLFPAKT